MSSIGSDYDALSALGLRSSQELSAEAKNKKDELGMDTFLKLMTTQLQNQDPMKPMENGDFLSQLAQFSSVKGLQQLNDSFSTLSASMSSSQALQAGGLVGKSVLVPSSFAPLTLDKGLNAELNLESSANDIKVRVYNANNVLVKTMNLGTQTKGQLGFTWDGSLDAGGYANPGVYRLEADFSDGRGRSPLETTVSASVDSVVVGGVGQGLTLNLTGLGPVPFNKVSRIQ